MKQMVLVLACCVITSTVSAQFVARMQVDEPIEGICDEKEVYALFPMLNGQIEAEPSISMDEITAKLNELTFLKENPKYKDKGMLNVIINCKGEVVQCKMDGNGKIKSKVLNDGIINVFRSQIELTAGKLNGQAVDSILLYSFKIKKGQLTFES